MLTQGQRHVLGRGRGGGGSGALARMKASRFDEVRCCHRGSTYMHVDTALSGCFSVHNVLANLTEQCR